jgi:hypothetical protein
MASIESQLGGKATFDWRTEGVVCLLRVPIAQETRERNSDDPHPTTGAGLASNSGSQRTVASLL